MRCRVVVEGGGLAEAMDLLLDARQLAVRPAMNAVLFAEFPQSPTVDA